MIVNQNLQKEKRKEKIIFEKNGKPMALRNVILAVEQVKQNHVLYAEKEVRNISLEIEGLEL